MLETKLVGYSRNSVHELNVIKWRCEPSKYSKNFNFFGLRCFGMSRETKTVLEKEDK